MTLRQTLIDVGTAFHSQRGPASIDKKTTAALERQAVDTVKQLIARMFQNYVVIARVGERYRQDVTRITLAHPDVSLPDSSDYGITYLFHCDARKVTLSLNRNSTRVFNKPGPEHRTANRHPSDLPETVYSQGKLAGFSALEIDLGSRHSDAKAYERGHRLGITYEMIDLPSNVELETDLVCLAAIYNTLFLKPGKRDRRTIKDAPPERPAPALISETKTYKIHRVIERNSRDYRQLKQKRSTGICGCCGFNFSEFYGPIGDGFIEMHHLVPLASLREGESRVYHEHDFAFLCANCHRMAHRLDDPSNIGDLRQRIEQARREMV